MKYFQKFRIGSDTDIKYFEKFRIGSDTDMKNFQKFRIGSDSDMKFFLNFRIGSDTDMNIFEKFRIGSDSDNESFLIVSDRIGSDKFGFRIRIRIQYPIAHSKGHYSSKGSSFSTYPDWSHFLSRLKKHPPPPCSEIFF